MGLFMTNSMPSLFSAFFKCIILIAILTLTFMSITNKFPYFGEYEHNHFAKALTSKYPEVGLPSPRGPTILIQL